MKNAKVLNSPRGPWMLSSSNNPVQNIYLREVKNGKNQLIGKAWENLEDPSSEYEYNFFLWITSYIFNSVIQFIPNWDASFLLR